jgi:hypothetical protein
MDTTWVGFTWTDAGGEAPPSGEDRERRRFVGTMRGGVGIIILLFLA